MNVDRISNIQNRINQIEQNFNPDVQVKSQSFQTALSNVQSQGTMRIDNPQMAMAMPGMNMMQPGMNMPVVSGPFNQVGAPNCNVKPIAQNNGVSCGQTSVAMCINSITGKNLTDADVNGKYGFQLLNALNSETSANGVNWRDGGNMSPYSWNLIDQKVNNEGLPVIVALNGPEFSPSGRGHIVTIVKTQGDNVYYADPASGEIKTTTKQAMENAPKHPDGNFLFFGTRGTGNQFAAST